MTDSTQRQQLHFLARLGATMCDANYPVPLVRELIDRASRKYGTPCTSSVLPVQVQVTGACTDTGTVVEDTPKTFTGASLVGNDTDPDLVYGDTLSVHSVSGATNGAVVLNADGTADLYVDPAKVDDAVTKHLGNAVRIVPRRNP